MKTFIASLAVLAVMIAGGIGCDVYLGSIAEEVDMYVSKTDMAAQKENYVELLKGYKMLTDCWKENLIFLAALVDHTHMGEISKTLSEMETGIKTRELTEVMLAGARVRQIMKNVAENEHFCIENIL